MNIDENYKKSDFNPSLLYPPLGDPLLGALRGLRRTAGYAHRSAAQDGKFRAPKYLIEQSILLLSPTCPLSASCSAGGKSADSPCT